MREMTKLEKALFVIEWLFNKTRVKIGTAIGLVKAETSPFEGGTRTVYKNLKGETIYELREF